MRFMMVIGLMATIVVWSNYGPGWGLLTGFLMMGGLGWKLLAAAAGGAVGIARPDTKEFTAAWEERAGRMEFGVPQTYPPPGMYQAWRRDRRHTGESAGVWLDRVLQQAAEAATEPTLVRHVDLYPDGKGATFELRVVGGEPKWRWSYDSGTPDNFNTTVMTEVAITNMEKELGLPLTFPHLDPDREPEEEERETEEEREQRLADLRRRASGGDVHAKFRLWRDTGKPVTDPSELVEGNIYCLYDLAVYGGTFVGRRWQGFPDLDDEPEIAEWFTFEAAQTDSKNVGKAGSRYKREDFPSPRDQEGYFTAVVPQTSQEELRQAFDRMREEHLEWERNRPPERFH